MRTCLVFAVALSCAWAQTQPPPATARMEGQVVADANGLPLRRVQVILSPLEAGKPAIGTQTDDKGKFILRDIPPGGYQLSAQRDGYLTTSTFRRGTLRMPARFTLAKGDSILDVGFRLRPWSVLSGEVRFEDGEPAVNMPVELYRQYHLRGRRGFARVASTRTNDRGEYRIHGLAPAAYFVAVSYEGDLTGPNVDDQPRLDSNGKELPVPSYTTTFFPNTLKLSEASPVRLREGDDLSGIDFYMRVVDRVKVSGRITEGVAGTVVTAAAVTLERLDAGNTGTLPVPIDLTFDQDKFFHIANVAPGTYQMWIDATVENQRLVGRSLLTVTNFDIEGLDLVVLPSRPWRGELIAASGAAPLPRDFRPRVTLEPRSERGAIIVPSFKDGAFEVSFAPNETYDVFIPDLPDDLYISEIRASGVDVRATGLGAGMASNQPFQIVLESRGGKIAGAVSGAGVSADEPPWSGAQVTLIPDPPRDRLQDYRETFASEFGEFKLNGVPPGRYILTAWLDEPTCDIYDAEALDACRATGMIVDVKQSSQQEIPLQIKRIPGR